MKLLEGVKADATLSLDHVYRYALFRDWFPKPNQQHVLWTCLNPSKADKDVDDATARRCQAFAKEWGYDGVTICNLFALRSTDPKALYTHPDPVGPENDEVLRGLFGAKGIGMVIAAWGVHGKLFNRGAAVLDLAYRASRNVYCMGLTKEGFPKHPLYLKGDTQPVLWKENDFIF